jgi:hypothetical protein
MMLLWAVAFVGWYTNLYLLPVWQHQNTPAVGGGYLSGVILPGCCTMMLLWVVQGKVKGGGRGLMYVCLHAACVAAVFWCGFGLCRLKYMCIVACAGCCVLLSLPLDELLCQLLSARRFDSKQSQF